MSRKIILRKDGLTNTPTVPNGYKTIGLSGDIISEKEVDNIKNLSGLERIEMISFGIPTSSLTSIEGRMCPSFWITKWRYMLWDILAEDGTILESGKSYSNDIDSSNLISDIDLHRGVGKDKVVVNIKAYIYSNLSNDKLRITGRNLAYWLMKGPQNYLNRSGRVLFSAGTSEQLGFVNFLRANIDSNIGTDGHGVNFSTGGKNQYSSYLQIPNGSLNTLDSALAFHARSLIRVSDGVNVLSTTLTNAICSPTSTVYTLGIDRDSIINTDPILGDSIIQLLRIDVNSDQGAHYFYTVKAIGQDTFLPTYKDLGTNELFMFVEKMGKNEIIKVDLNIPINNNGVGTDVSNILTAVKYDRIGSIWLNDMLSKLRGPSGFKTPRELVKNNMKIRFGYGKDGTYTFSNEYITFNRQKVNNGSDGYLVPLVKNMNLFTNR